MRKEGIAYLYEIKRTATGQQYIGITINPKLRWWTHRWSAGKSPSFIHKAIAKYGPDAFTFKIIGNAPSWAEGADMERQFIKQYACHVSQGGYNLTFGGEGTLGRIVSQETRALHSMIMKGRPGRPIPPKERELHRQQTLQRYADDPQSFIEGAKKSIESRVRNGNTGVGRKNTDETKARMSASAKLRWSSKSESERRTIVVGSCTEEDRHKRAKRGAKTRIIKGTQFKVWENLSDEQKTAKAKRGWETRRKTSTNPLRVPQHH